MKQFSLEEFLKNPNRKVVTRDGRAVKIHCTDYLGIQPIFATIEGDAYPCTFCKNGRYMINEESPRDLFFATKKHKGWVNIFKGEGYRYTGDAFIYKSREDAEKQGKSFSDYIATVKIEWEE